MTEADQAKLKALREMTETLGWQVFVREHTESATAMRHNVIESCKTLEQLNYTKGFVAALEALANYEKQLDAIEEADKAQAEHEDSAPTL